jgi:hypothetical protein
MMITRTARDRHGSTTAVRGSGLVFSSGRSFYIHGTGRARRVQIDGFSTLVQNLYYWEDYRISAFTYNTTECEEYD